MDGVSATVVVQDAATSGATLAATLEEIEPQAGRRAKGWPEKANVGDREVAEELWRDPGPAFNPAGRVVSRERPACAS
jgi:hypothetical protein